MKTLLKAFFIGLLILIANVIIAGWAWHMIGGLINVITNSSGWLVVAIFLLFVIMLAAIIFLITAQGAIILQLINESKVKEKSDE